MHQAMVAASVLMVASPSSIPPSRAILRQKPIPDRYTLIITVHKLMVLFTVASGVGFTSIMEQLPFLIPPSLETLLHSPTLELLKLAIFTLGMVVAFQFLMLRSPFPIPRFQETPLRSPIVGH